MAKDTEEEQIQYAPMGGGGQIETVDMGDSIHFGPSGSGITLPKGSLPDGSSYQEYLLQAQQQPSSGLSLGGVPGASIEPPIPAGGGGEPNDWDWVDPAAPPSGGGGGNGDGTRPWHGTLGQRDTSWDWDYFKPKQQGDNAWGGFDQDYQVSERYQPGQESPWGTQGVEGGNTDFYREQFSNMLRDEQGFRNRQRGAQMRADEPQNVKEGSPWDWAYGGQGLPDVRMGGEARAPTYDLLQGLTTDSTQGDLIRKFSGMEAFKDNRRDMQYWLENSSAEDLANTNWANQGSPDRILHNLGSGTTGEIDPATGFKVPTLSQPNREWMSKMANAMYQEGSAGAYAPAGYASPIQWGGDYQSGAQT